MQKGKYSIITIVMILVLIGITACTPSRISVDEYNQGSSVEPTAAPEASAEVVPESVEQQATAPVVEASSENSDDVPIMDDAYQVQKGKSSIIYQVDGSVEDVVAYYQAELPNYGWELSGPPDNAVGAIATMLRENANGDLLAINMQYNSVGDFVRITITLSRAK
jgi:hypothetical protein